MRLTTVANISVQISTNSLPVTVWLQCQKKGKNVQSISNDAMLSDSQNNLNFKYYRDKQNHSALQATIHSVSEKNSYFN